MARATLIELAQTEAVKEFFRLIIIAVIPVAIDSLQKGNLDFRTLLIVAAIAGLRAIDRFLYKADNQNPVTNLLKLE